MRGVKLDKIGRVAKELFETKTKRGFWGVSFSIPWGKKAEPKKSSHKVDKSSPPLGGPDSDIHEKYNGLIEIIGNENFRFKEEEFWKNYGELSMERETPSDVINIPIMKETMKKLSVKLVHAEDLVIMTDSDDPVICVEPDPNVFRSKYGIEDMYTNQVYKFGRTARFAATFNRCWAVGLPHPEKYLERKVKRLRKNGADIIWGMINPYGFELASVRFLDKPDKE